MQKTKTMNFTLDFLGFHFKEEIEVPEDISDFDLKIMYNKWIVETTGYKNFIMDGDV